MPGTVESVEGVDSRLSAKQVEVLAVVVSAGTTPYLADTLRAVARQMRPPEVVLLVDVASRANGLGSGEPVEEAVEAADLDTRCAVRIVRAPEARNLGDAVRRGLDSYGELVAAGNRRRHRERTTTASTTSGTWTGPTGALSPITTGEIRMVGSGGSEGPGPHTGSQTWLWLLHDDSAPHPTCLEMLLDAVTTARSVALAGPKQVDWDNPDELLEVGLRTTASARRANDIVPGEIDQGQHDDRSDVLAVGTAGALINREVWDTLGGTSPALGPYGDGLEFSRAVRLAGHRVVVVPAAVVRHRRAAYLGLRPEPIEAGPAAPDHGGPLRPDPDRTFRARRVAQLTSWATFTRRRTAVLLGFVLVPLGLARALWRLLAKTPTLADDELRAVLEVLARPGRIRDGRARLAAHATVPRSVLSALYVHPSEIRAMRRDRGRQERERLRRATAPSELELSELGALARRRRTVLGVVVALLAVIAGVGLGSVVVTRAVTGGAVASVDLSWREAWTQAWGAWVPSGDGYATEPTPLLAVISLVTALVSPLGLGADDAVHLLLVLALPLAGIGAWFAAGTVTRRTSLRAWGAVAWACAPTALLALGQGRVVALAVHLILPWALVAVARALGADRRDVVLSGLVGAHHLTADEEAELGRWEGARVEDLSRLDEGATQEEAAEVARQDAKEKTARDASNDAGAPQEACEAEDDIPAPRPSAAVRAEGMRTAPADDIETPPASEEAAPCQAGDPRPSPAGPAENSPAQDEATTDGDLTREAGRMPDTADAGGDLATEEDSESADEDSDAASHDGAHVIDDNPATPVLDDARGVVVGAGTSRGAARRAAATEAYGPGSATAAAAAGLLLAIITALAPGTAVLTVPLLLLAALTHRRAAPRLTLSLAPVLAVAAPTWLQAWSAATWQDGVRLLVTEAGAPVSVAAPSPIEMLLGIPVDVESLGLPVAVALAVKAACAVVPAAAVLAALAPGRHGARARAGLLVALGGLALAALAVRTTTSVGTDLATGATVLVPGWAGTGLSLALAGLLGAALSGVDLLHAGLVHRVPATRRAVAALVGVAGLACPLLLGGAWAVWAPRSGDATVMALTPATQQVPLIAGETQISASRGRVLVLTSARGALHAVLWRGPGTQLTDVLPAVLTARLVDTVADASVISPILSASDATGSTAVEADLLDDADAELADAVSRAITGGEEDVADLLAAHGIAVVLVTDNPGDETTASAVAGLDATDGLDRLARTATGTSWRVTPTSGTEAARAVLLAANGTTTTVPADATRIDTEIPASPDGAERTLVLADRADAGWHATLDGQRLPDADLPATSAGSWRQAFTLPAQGGHLVVTRDTPASTVTARVAWAVLAMAALAALPLRRRRSLR